jgi:hypothetical protein
MDMFFHHNSVTQQGYDTGRALRAPSFRSKKLSNHNPVLWTAFYHQAKPSRRDLGAAFAEAPPTP